jgi:hypothetical protein
MKVYLLFVGFYCDRMIQGIFSTHALADAFKNTNLPSHDDWSGIEEWEVDTLVEPRP